MSVRHARFGYIRGWTWKGLGNHPRLARWAASNNTWMHLCIYKKLRLEAVKCCLLLYNMELLHRRASPVPTLASWLSILQSSLSAEKLSYGKMPFLLDYMQIYGTAQNEIWRQIGRLAFRRHYHKHKPSWRAKEQLLRRCFVFLVAGPWSVTGFVSQTLPVQTCSFSNVWRKGWEVLVVPFGANLMLSLAVYSFKMY